MEARTLSLTHKAIASSASSTAEARHAAHAHAAGLRVVSPISAAVRAELEAEAAIFAEAVAELAGRERRGWERLPVSQLAAVEECPGCAEPVEACTCLHRICY